MCGFFQAKQLKLLFSLQQTVGVIACFAKECFTEAFKFNLEVSSPPSFILQKASFIPWSLLLILCHRISYRVNILRVV